jgi:glycosyltransferase involved in cell wall biosynthesis
MTPIEISSPPVDRRPRTQVALSLVMPCYNEAEHIEECLRNWAECLADEVESFEILVVNDGSMDGTARVLDRLRKEMPALRVIHQLNGGQDAAIRRGYEAARGSYVLQTEANGRFDPTDFAAFWEKRQSYGLLVARRTRPLEGWLARGHDRIVRGFVRFLFAAEWQEPHTPFRLMSRACLEDTLKRLPRGFAQVNLGLTLLAHSEDPAGVTELPVPFRFPNGLRRRPSLFSLLMSVIHTGFELIQLRLRLLKPSISNTSPLEAT